MNSIDASKTSFCITQSCLNSVHIFYPFIVTRSQQKPKHRRKLTYKPAPATEGDDDVTYSGTQSSTLDKSTSFHSQSDILFGGHSSFNTQTSVSVLDNSTLLQSQGDSLSATQSSAATCCFSNQSGVSENKCFQNHNEDIQDVPQESSLQGDKMSEFELPSCSFNNSDEKADMLISIFPSMSAGQIKFLLELTKGDCDMVSNILLEGISAENLINLWKQGGGEIRRIRVETYRDEDTLEELLAFYKSSRFNPHSIVRISIEDQPAIDTGGIRRQFYSDAFIKLSNNEDLFERTESGVLPVFRQSTLSSGLFTTIGKLIGHSIVMDGQGFPYMSPSIYYYMAGLTNTAVSAVSMKDLGSYTKHIVSKVKS